VKIIKTRGAGALISLIILSFLFQIISGGKIFSDTTTFKEFVILCFKKLIKFLKSKRIKGFNVNSNANIVVLFQFFLKQELITNIF